MTVQTTLQLGTETTLGHLFDRFSLGFGWVSHSLHESLSLSISTLTGVY
jgi:hypothetical protein